MFDKILSGLLSGVTQEDVPQLRGAGLYGDLSDFLDLVGDLAESWRIRGLVSLDCFHQVRLKISELRGNLRDCRLCLK